MRRLGDHVLVQVPPEPGQVGLLGEEELVLLAAREDLDEGAVAGHGGAALHRLPRHHGVSLRRLQRPQVEQLAELKEEEKKETGEECNTRVLNLDLAN